MTIRRGELESMAGVFSRSEQTERERERENGIDNRRGRDERKKAGRLIFRGRPTNLEREGGRERGQKREKEFTAAEWSIVGRARPFDDCQLEKYSNSITIFFVRSHTPNRGRI